MIKTEKSEKSMIKRFCDVCGKQVRVACDDDSRLEDCGGPLEITFNMPIDGQSSFSIDDICSTCLKRYENISADKFLHHFKRLINNQEISEDLPF